MLPCRCWGAGELCQSDSRTGSFGSDRKVWIHVTYFAADTFAAGPLLGMTGTVTGLLGGKQRVQVLIEFLGRVSEAEVSVHDVQSGRVPQQSLALD